MMTEALEVLLFFFGILCPKAMFLEDNNAEWGEITPVGMKWPHWIGFADGSLEALHSPSRKHCSGESIALNYKASRYIKQSWNATNDHPLPSLQSNQESENRHV
jgi:hypothetical protein